MRPTDRPSSRWRSGVYPHLNVADAHFSVVRYGVQHCVHASRFLGMERMDLEVGPIRIEVIEPLKSLRITVADETGISAELLFEGRAFPIEEPRFTHRIGPRTFLDYTRMTQNGRYSGWISVDGVRVDMPAGASARATAAGVCARSARQTRNRTPRRWSPASSGNGHRSTSPTAACSSTSMPTRRGDAFNVRSVIVPDGAQPANFIETIDAELETSEPVGHAPSPKRAADDPARDTAPVTIHPHPGQPFPDEGHRLSQPDLGPWPLQGRARGRTRGHVFAELDPLAIDNFHIQFPCEAVLEQDGAAPMKGIGVFEQLILGPYAPMGFAGMTDPAP